MTVMLNIVNSFARQSVACTLLLLPGAAMAFDAPLSALLESHCAECHAGGAQEGGLDIDSLRQDLTDQETFARWERIFDRVQTGEMPPPDAEPFSKVQQAQFLRSLAAPLVKAHAATKGTVLRRLNRVEYQNTINDMFGTHLDLADMLPEDGRAHEFDNVGDALNISVVQLQAYMDAAEAVLDTAIADTVEKPDSKVVRASYADTRGAEKFLGKNWLKLDDGAVVFFQRVGYPSGMLREANVRSDGFYKIRVTGYAHQSDQPITFSIGSTTFARGAKQPTYGFYAFTPGDPQTVEITAWVDRNYMIEVTPFGIYDPENKIRQEGIEQYRGPGLAVQHIEVEGPIVDQFPSPGHRLLFDGLDRQEVMPGNLKDREKSWYKPKFELANQSEPAVTASLRRLATKAFRRPVTASDIQPYVQLYQAQRTEGATAEVALRAAATAILCSPDFLFLREPPGWLDDHAIAARLSYFLTRTSPDDQLLQAAAAGQLSKDRQVMISHTDRLLNHAHLERFARDFTDAWLDLRNIDFTAPDKRLFPEYDPYLQHSLLAETRSYFRRLIDENAAVVNIVKSDFAMLNERLAQHYQIDGVVGPELRPVSLPADSLRGGFLSHGSILKVSANGTNTSPVVRGVWVNERILGNVPPPPPAGVAGVEPDIRGAKTLRELLDKHRDLDSCRACHQMIDPPGFALESFNPIGGFRDRFRTVGDGERVNEIVHGRKVNFKLGLDVDASGELPDGKKFAGFRDYRDHLSADENRLAKAFVTKLLIFATGRDMGFSDRPIIDQIVATSAAQGHGIRDLIHLVVQSEIFRQK